MERGDYIVHIVDDEEPVRKSLAFMLTVSGFAVRLHDSATAFLAAAPRPKRLSRALMPPEETDEALEAAGLLATDTGTASDHLPLAADLVSTRSTSVAQQAPEQVTVRVAPNPFSDRTVVSIDQPRPGTVTIEVYDVLGRRVAVPFDGRLAAGPQQVPVDASALAPGVYLYRVRTADGVAGGTLVRR